MTPGMGTWVGARNFPFLASKTEPILHPFPLLASGTWPWGPRAACRSAEERAKQDELVKELAPRELWVAGYKDNTSNIDRLKALSGGKHEVAFAGDA
jgi:hypothetical protein